MTPAQYQAWYAKQQQMLNTAGAQVAQLRSILTSQGDLGN